MALVISLRPNKILKFLAQNCIRLEPGPFRVWPLDFLVQNIELFTTPKYGTVVVLSLSSGCLDLRMLGRSLCRVFFCFRDHGLILFRNYYPFIYPLDFRSFAKLFSSWELFVCTLLSFRGQVIATPPFQIIIYLTF